MKLNLKRMALASLLATLGASAFAANYFFVAPKSMEMSKVAPFNLALGAYTLPGAVTGLAYNGGAGYDLNSLVSISGDPALNSALVSFAVTSGSLPAGLVLSAGGRITGTPTEASSGIVQVTASYKNATGAQTYAMASISLAVTLAHASLPLATVGMQYNTSGFDFAPLISAPADPAFNANLATFVLSSGSIPGGMSLSSSGKLTGIPAAISSSVPLQVTASYKSNTVTKSYDWVAVAGAATDSNWSKVTVLLHGEGANASTTITNSASAGSSVGISGSVTVSTAKSKVGTSAISFPALANAYLTAPLDAKMKLGTGDFTIETWFNPTSRAAEYPTLYSNYSTYTTGSLGIFAGHKSSSANHFQVYANGEVGAKAPLISSSTTIAYGVWQHVALVRMGDTLTLYINGSANGSASVAGFSFNGYGSLVTVGVAQTAQGLTSYLHGYLDEYRISSVARYTSNFTPPILAFPDQGPP